MEACCRLSLRKIRVIRRREKRTEEAQERTGGDSDQLVALQGLFRTQLQSVYNRGHEAPSCGQHDGTKMCIASIFRAKDRCSVTWREKSGGPWRRLRLRRTTATWVLGTSCVERGLAVHSG